ncbi:MAG: ribosome-binding factor A [Chlorobi bacterium]|nr:ribosome-binding factor A [Chlorobiota bacterium]
MQSLRHQRLNKLIQEFFAEILEQERGKSIHPDLVITATEARLNDKKTLATIFLAVSNADNPQQVIDEFNRTSKYWRRRLSEKLRYHLRRMPDVRFKLDEGAQRYLRIDELLEQDRKKRESNQ